MAVVHYLSLVCRVSMRVSCYSPVVITRFQPLASQRRRGGRGGEISDNKQGEGCGVSGLEDRTALWGSTALIAPDEPWGRLGLKKDTESVPAS